jgi:hypothetical protein
LLRVRTKTCRASGSWGCADRHRAIFASPCQTVVIWL